MIRMNMISLKEFVTPFYDKKDMFHDLSHIERVLINIKKLVINYQDSIDIESLIYAVYFHGVIDEYEKDIIYWMKNNSFSQAHIDYIIKVSKESQIDSIAETIDGKILHDAHLIEGGKAFLVIKYFSSQANKGYTYEDTIEYIEKLILKKCKCYLPETEKLYNEKIDYAKEIVEDLKEGII